MSKIALVTGGNRGIGLEICRQLAAEGFTVIMGSRDEAKGTGQANFIQGNVIAKQLDVTNSADIEQIAKYIQNEFGHLDVLINNAGIGVGNRGSVDADLGEVRRIIDTNFFGAWELSQAVIPLLRQSDDGRIINMSSGMGELRSLRSGGYAGYRLSKTALNALTILMASELAGNNIRVNAMCPGWVRTDMGGSSATRSVEQGADTATWLSTAADIPSGQFFRDRAVIDW